MSNTAFKKPVIFLAFANDADEHLGMLNKERDFIYDALHDAHEKNYIQVHKQENTSIDDVFNQFLRYDGRVEIFHYAGHASGTHLRLESGAGETELADAGGLAQLLGKQTGLQLVFLNGCATLDQVELLHKAGVKAVIATSVPINDDMAMEFATKFYESLATSQVSLEKAFEKAKDGIALRYGSEKEIKIHRGIGKRKKSDTEETLPWGLYINENANPVLDWKLPDRPKSFDFGNQYTPAQVSAVSVNQILLDLLKKSHLPAYNRKLGRFLEDVVEGEEDQEDIPLKVVDCFPLPIGKQLCKLFTPELAKPGESRLKQLGIVYQTVVELISYIVLSQFWEDLYQERKNLPQKSVELIKQYLEQDEEANSNFSYIKLLETLSQAFKEIKSNSIVEELNDLDSTLQQEDFREACAFLEDLYYQYRHVEFSTEDEENENGDGAEIKAEVEKSVSPEIVKACLKAEEYLGTAISGFAFVVKYELMTIKDIKITHYRFSDPEYSHRRFKLTRATRNENMKSDHWKKYGSFAESESVILIKTTRNSQDELPNFDQYLSLSPFLVDKNALVPDAEKSRLFSYHYHQAQDDRYCFRDFNNREDVLEVSKMQYPQIRDQFIAFRRAILGRGGNNGSK